MTQTETTSGYVYGMSAFLLWGIFPLFFKAMLPMDSMDIVSWRIVLGVPTIAIFLAAAHRWHQVRTALADRKVMLTLFASAVLIAINWVVYVIGVNSGRVLATSLGYYLNPLFSILLGFLLLKERSDRLQWAALALAGAGVAALLFGALADLWITLSLATSFTLYGLLRKTVGVGAAPGLFIETLLLAPLFLLWLAMLRDSSQPLFGPEPYHLWLILVSGAVTAVPLLLFTEGARRLPYSTIGILQFIAPTLQFLLGVFLFGELFTPVRAFAFACIWSAMALYIYALVRRSKKERVILVKQ